MKINKSMFVFASLLFMGMNVVYGNVTQTLSGAPSLLIPAAGSTPGANGTFFRTDLTLVNLKSQIQDVEVRWLPQAGTGTPTVRTLALNAGDGITSADFVREYLGVAGLGSLLITGVTTSGEPDATALLVASSRIWTPQPGTDGTTSQSFPVIPAANIFATPTMMLFGIGGPAVAPYHFRANVGIVNADPINAQTFSIGVTSIGPPPQPLIVTIPPLSMQQVSIGPGPGSPTLGLVRITNVTADATRSGRWAAYGSTIDQVTGDAWSESATPLP